MKSNFELFKTIHPISGASGIIKTNKDLLLISDSSFVLYRYSLKAGTLDKINLLETEELHENIEKKLKPDFESIASTDSHYFIFGSGSAQNRFHLIQVNIQSLKVVGRFDLKELYHDMMKIGKVASKDFNIEGVVILGDTFFFFNRGNGPQSQNGIFRVKNFMDNTQREIAFHLIELPRIEDVALGFTDAIAVGENFYFVANAESGESTYHDGDVLGSGVGVIRIKDFKLLSFEIITDNHKLEGITVYQIKDENIEFLLCEDPDDDSQLTRVFKWSCNF